jgi:hypothetical protein
MLYYSKNAGINITKMLSMVTLLYRIPVVLIYFLNSSFYSVDVIQVTVTGAVALQHYEYVGERRKTRSCRPHNTTTGSTTVTTVVAGASLGESAIAVAVMYLWSAIHKTRIPEHTL